MTFILEHIIEFGIPIGTFIIGMYGKLVYSRMTHRKQETDAITSDFASIQSISQNYLDSLHSITEELEGLNMQILDLRARLNAALLEIGVKDTEIKRLQEELDKALSQLSDLQAILQKQNS
jgi:peptidoglycan hydrolase CwlO-like protein